MPDEQKDPPEEQTAGTEPETGEGDDKPVTESKYSDLQPGKLEDLLKAHHEWVTTGGRTGTQANFSYTNLQRADLGSANLQRAYLFCADLRGTYLKRVNLKEADLGGAELRDANLQDANLTGAIGLQAQQLGGASVSGAKLDDNIEKGFDQGLAVVQEASKNARKLFLTMLLACVYSLLTIATTTDLRLILNSGTSELPIIRTQVPIVWFYLAAPPFLLGIFVYFHLYMQRLWEGLGKLPAIFPDGRELDEKAYPWLLIGLCRAHVPLLREAKRKWFLGLQNLLAIILAWAVTPLTLYMFWARYVPKHDWDGTGFHLSLVALSAFFAFRFYRAAVDALGGVERPAGLIDVQPRTPSAVAEYITKKLRPVFVMPRAFFRKEWDDIRARYKKWRTYTALTTTAVIVWLIFLSFAAITREQRFSGAAPPFFRPYADLSGQDISEGWESDVYEQFGRTVDGGHVRGAYLVGRNLRYARLSAALVVNAFLDSANLQGANLSRANLAGATLTRANLQGADLRLASLHDARLNEANLQGADLSGVVGFTDNVRDANIFGVRNLLLRTLLDWLDQGAICLESQVVNGNQVMEARQAVTPYLAAALVGDSTAIRRIKMICGITAP